MTIRHLKPRPITSTTVHDIPAIEHTVVLTTIPAPIETCFEVGIDLDAYPEWVKGIASVEVEARDELGRPIRARFEATAMGRHTSYVLSYDLSGAPNRLAWNLVEGDLTTRLEGAYLFELVGSPDGCDVATDVTYELIVDLVVPLPGYVKRRAEEKIVESALQRFKDRVVAKAALGNEA
jgi:ribosome-associated toxin RatA of RatAB toxin-antitoxin module